MKKANWIRRFVVGAALLLAGCAGQSSTLDATTGQQRTFALTADQADHVILAAFKEELPSYTPTAIPGPPKAYTVRFTFMLDFQNITASEIPVVIKAVDGSSSTQYGFAVTDDGSSFVQGRMHAENLFRSIMRIAIEKSASR